MNAARSIHKLLDLSGRVALVTGGGGHIGSVVADAFAEAGASVAILDVDEEGCKKTASRLASTYGVVSFPMIVDLSDQGAISSIPASLSEQFESLDILVNCAAFVGSDQMEGWAVPFENQSAEAWQKAFEMNLLAPFLLTQSCAGLLRASGRGSVINLASIYGIVASNPGLYESTELENPAAYGSLKAGLIQLTRWLATNLAPEIRVNSISPGGVWRDQPHQFEDRYISRTPLRRMATEEDLKGAAIYLASDLSAYVTGHNLVVDGGWTVW